MTTLRLRGTLGTVEGIPRTVTEGVPSASMLEARTATSYAWPFTRLPMRSEVDVLVVTGPVAMTEANSVEARSPPRGRDMDCALAVLDQVTPPSRL